MSIFSNFLNLFKYQPTEDAQNTFNIKTALNDNWDKVDTFAANVSQEMEHKADLVGGKVPSEQLPAMDYASTTHTHTKIQITDFPTSLPANGGNAATVGGFTVGKSVPANAVFTDTIYVHPSTHPASMITGLPTSLPANGGNAATVGGFTVGKSVPANAVFTDTIYTHPSAHPASMITGLPTSLPASDVYAWAKASVKPAYAWSEISSKPTTFAPSAHTHDDRYFTEAEINANLNTKSNISHTHDERYYTEAEMNAKLAAKAPVIQSGTAAPTAFVGEGVLYGVHS